MCVSDALKLDFDLISVPDPDTDIVPFGLGCFASRGTYMATGAMYMAVNDMKSKLLRIGSELLGCKEEDLTLADGAVVALSDPGVRAACAEIAWKHVCDNPGQHILGIGLLLRPVSIIPTTKNTIISRAAMPSVVT